MLRGASPTRWRGTKYGCVVVAESDKVEGVFTTVDALAVLANLLWLPDASTASPAS